MTYFKAFQFKTLAIILLLLSVAQVASATTVVVPTDTEMLIGARAVVRGRVLQVETSYDEQRGEVFTYITLRVREVLKGAVTARRIVIKESGGQTADQTTMIYGMPEFKIGQQVLVYLDTRDDGTLRVHQMFLGKFNIVVDPFSGRDVVVRENASSEVNVLDGVSDGAVTNRMELESYRQLVVNTLAANKDRAEEFEAAHYNRIPLRARPREYQNLSKGSRLGEQFTLLSNGRWFEPDTGQNVTFFVNPASAPNGTAAADMTAAMNAWSTVSGTSLRLVNGGSTTNCSSVGNTIVFNNCDSRFSAGSSCSGVLAVGGWNGGGGSIVVNGVTFTRISRGFVSFNPFMTCFLANSCNLREVATHELGHAVGLGHSWQSSHGGSPTALQQDATMFWSAHGDSRCASVRTDDRNGIVFIYPGSSTPPPPTTVTVSGRATIGTTPLSGVAFSGSGATCGASDSQGNYSCSVSSGWSGTITPSRSGVTFSPASRSYSNVTANQTGQDFAGSSGDTDGDSIPNYVEFTEGRNPNLKDNDVFNNGRLFAMQQYRDFLGREGDSSGVTWWANQINSGAVNRPQTIESFFNSAEFQNTTAPVTRLYFAYFLRIPDYGGLTFWVTQYRNGTTLNAISQSFSQSQEFNTRYGSLDNSAFVSLVYNNVLGRTPDAGGLTFWTNQLNTAAMTRGQVMLAFSESPEYRGGIFNEVYVTQVYIGMLRRSPDQSGFGFWLGRLDGGESGLSLISSFLGSSEYRNRFMP